MLDVDVSAFALGTSHPAAESIIAVLKGTPRDTGLDYAKLAPINAYLKEIRKKYKEFESKLQGVDINVVRHQIPGGMRSNLEFQLAQMKAQYDKVSFALHEVMEKGYGIVSPSTEELTLDEPKIVKQGGRFGVKLKASAPSIHMIRADIETEVSPIVGTEKQSEELVHYLLSEFETDPTKIWQSNIFGKSLYELVNEGLHNKLSRMPESARMKLKETLQRIINDGSNGLICIIL